MKNGDNPAFSTQHTIDGNWNTEPDRELMGLTKREYFAAMAMQGLVMNRTLIYDYIGDDTKVQFSELISKESIRIADELLNQLES